MMSSFYDKNLDLNLKDIDYIAIRQSKSTNLIGYETTNIFYIDQ